MTTGVVKDAATRVARAAARRAYSVGPAAHAQGARAAEPVSARPLGPTLHGGATTTPGMAHAPTPAAATARIQTPDAAPGTAHAPPPSRHPNEKHRLLYRQVLPPVIRVLAYSTMAYFALHLTWGLLNDAEEKAAQKEDMDRLKGAVRKEV
ncbi:hypothetical protein MSPP1_002943 [Malassezia sp. CBS 17886]|nr:hypothetical protein MSPP1_002943 [Malassezia sp. CBS 17886]